MKQIFDWLREQMSKLHKKNPYDSYWERDMYLATEATNYERDETIRPVYKLINEAEAKWEADCCVWTELIEYKQRVYANCRFTNDSLDAMSIGYFNFCPYCGKRIKISEVE